MFYVATVIAFRTFWELLWRSTLLVCYKLNRFQPPRTYQFDICALLLGGYDRFVPLDKIVLYSYWKPVFWKFIDVTFHFDIVSVL